MNLLVVGGGGREHAIIKKLRENPQVETIYALPGNGGIARDAVCVPEIGAKDIDGIVDFATSHDVDFAVVAPDDPLALGCVDRLHAAGVPCFGPDAKAARIESSKVFAKNLMKKYHIPTARYEVFDDPAKALAYLRSGVSFPIVVKADGLALGKGVLIPQNLPEAEAAVKSIMEDRAFGDSGREIVIEEFLTGPEVSVLAFTDGTAIRPMVSSMDHKRSRDGDTGLNTGGMGSVSPVPFADDSFMAKVEERIVRPTVNGLRAEGIDYRGFIFLGLINVESEPMVIEYNVRMGDPETEVVMPRIASDLLPALVAIANGNLGDTVIEHDPRTAVAVMAVSGGYPGSYAKGKVIEGLDKVDGIVFHAGTALDDKGRVVTSGGRVLATVAFSDDIPGAAAKSYEMLDKITFEGKYNRRDIGRDLV